MLEILIEKHKVKKILYIDMDGVITDFNSGLTRVPFWKRKKYKKTGDIPGIFKRMDPMPNAIESINELAKMYDIYVLSSAPWDNPSGWSEKITWIKKYFGKEEGRVLYERLIISSHKELNVGDYLVDDRLSHGADDFKGTLIHFGSDKFPDWGAVKNFLLHSKLENSI